MFFFQEGVSIKNNQVNLASNHPLKETKKKQKQTDSDTVHF